MKHQRRIRMLLTGLEKPVFLHVFKFFLVFRFLGFNVQTGHKNYHRKTFHRSLSLLQRFIAGFIIFIIIIINEFHSDASLAKLQGRLCHTLIASNTINQTEKQLLYYKN